MGCSFFRIQEELGLGGDLYKIESLNIIVQQTEKGGGVIPLHLWPSPSQSKGIADLCLYWGEPLIMKMMTIILSNSHCLRNLYVPDVKLGMWIISKPL